MNLFKDFDWKPLALVPVLALLVRPFIGSSSTWLTLTVGMTTVGSVPVSGMAPPLVLFAMITPTAPASCAAFAFATKVQVPRSITAIFPVRFAPLVIAVQASVGWVRTACAVRS